MQLGFLNLKLDIVHVSILRWNPVLRGRRVRLLGRGRWHMQERSSSGNFSLLCNINLKGKWSRELEEQLEKLRDRVAEASEGANWRSSEQEDVTDCQYQVKIVRKKR